MDQQNTVALQNCLKICIDTRQECQKTLSQHCLPKGGKHVADAHVAIMTDCIEICQVAADFLTRLSPMHTSVCAATANICDACADSCEAFTDDKAMLHCAEIVRACAKACRTTGQEDISMVADLETVNRAIVPEPAVAADNGLEGKDLPEIEKEFNVA